jgi:hypothetical protein
MRATKRLRDLEAQFRPELKRCPACRGRIIYEEHREDGTVTYPLGGPCSVCNNIPPDGGIGKFVVCAYGLRTGPCSICDSKKRTP